MNPAHLHLLVNHLPIIGSFLSVPLLLLALWRRADRGALLAAVFVVVLGGAGAVAAKLTGDGAEESVEDVPGVSERWIEEHEERADIATVLAVVCGVGALGVLGWAVRSGTTPVAPTAALTLGTLITSAAMAWTGQAGGMIRHTELRDPTSEVSAAAEAHEDED